MSVAGTWLWYDEFKAGSRAELGSYAFTRDNIIGFAGKYDPQGFHVDEEAAAKSHFGGLCASGWHTAAAYMKCCAAYNFAGCDAARARGIGLPPLGP
ncbi:MAG: MaoC/PaaZ C-terminal domain-containing protein, partial [Aestuariivirgaceae bacterium]